MGIEYSNGGSFECSEGHSPMIRDAHLEPFIWKYQSGNQDRGNL